VRIRKARLALCVVAATAVGGVFSSGAYGAIAFSNNNDITIPAGAPGTSAGSADPFPSSINVSGLLGTVGKATVTLTNLTHTWPDDMDILLSGPAGQTVMLLSDVGGPNDVTNVTLTFDDLGPIPDSQGQLTSGTYRPRNSSITSGIAGDNATDAFAAPAPAPPFGTTLGVFAGTDPNGTWSLWVDDDSATDIGALSGWTLNLDGPTLAPGTPPPPPPIPDPAPPPLAQGACANAQRGTGGNDTLLGTRAGDLLRGFAGADTLRGRRGADCLVGGRGGDDLFGARGNDRLTGGPGDDTLFCGPGRDVAIVSGSDDFFGCERVRRR
jgi:Ca2+-binding RTX toxin-like protein